MIEIYFGSDWREIIENTNNWWNCYDDNKLQKFTGILGDPKSFKSDKQESREIKVLRAFNNWVINLARVGFQLTDNNGRTN
jgi:CRISPR-associated protein Cmr2